jgi:sterol desaturase/sphingolipid hydroxylase (fatty acid hydroxylase superfamily)
MNPILYAIPVFLVTMLVEIVVVWRRGMKAYDLADTITSLQFGVLSQVSGLFLKLLALGIYAFVYAHVALAQWPMTSVAAWLVALLLYDLCYYWNHRLNHEVGVLWASHVVHHSSEYYNLSTALRQTSTGLLFGWIFYLPMALLGVPPLMFVAVGLIDLLYQYWVHTELVGKLGWFDRVFVSPSNHRVHHGQNDYCIDRNYGGILIIWDRLFGTFIEERDGEPICYGIRKPLHSFNPIWGNLHHYADMWQTMVRARGFRAKLDAWIAPPGGWRTGPIEHFEPSGFSRYQSPAPAPIKWAALGGYVLLNGVLVTLLVVSDHVGLVTRIAIAVGMAAMAALIGTMLMRQPQPVQPRSRQLEHH